MPLTRLATVLLLTLTVSGCDRLFDELSRLLWGVETTVTVISPTPVKVSSSPVRFELAEPARVVGTISQLCLSLRGDFPLAPPEAMSAEFKSLLRGASVNAVVTTTTGQTVPLVKLSQAWSKNGRIEKHNELAACAHEPERGQRLSAGLAIAKVELASTVPLDVRGVYWESSNAWDQGKKGN